MTFLTELIGQTLSKVSALLSVDILSQSAFSINSFHVVWSRLMTAIPVTGVVTVDPDVI